MKRSQIFQETLVDIGNAFRDIHSDLSELQTETKINAEVLDHLSQRVSVLENTLTDRRTEAHALSISTVFTVIAVIVAIIGMLFAAYEWRIDLRLVKHSQVTQQQIEDSIMKYIQKRSNK